MFKTLCGFALCVGLSVSCQSKSNDAKVKDDMPMDEASDPSKVLQSKKVQIGDVNIHYLEQGNGPLIVMLHGFPEYSGTWTNYLSRLSDQYKVVAPDLRGYNLSSAPTDVEAYAIEKLMADVTSLVGTLGHKKACLVGHDWGGLLSWYLAAHHPETFSKVVVMNAPFPKVYAKLYQGDDQQKAMAGYVGLFLTPGSELKLAANNYAALLNSYAASTHKYSADESQGLLDAWNHGLLGPLNYYRSYVPRQEQLAADLPVITIPTLLLWGEKDKALSIKNLDGLDPYITNLRIERYPNSSHWVNYEETDDISAKIRLFCAE